MGIVQQSKVYTQTVFGEFATPNYTITGSGALTSSMMLKRDGRFGRNARPFYIIDNYPMEGSISLPASVQGVPVAVQKPGGEVVWSTGSQNVTVYAEGVSIISGGAPTHNLIPGDILTNSITLEAFVDAKRVASGTPSFALQIFQADGAPVELGGGLSEIVVSATDAGAIFGGRGEHFESSTSLEIVGSLPGGVRYMVDGGLPKLVLHDGEFVEARFAGLSTLAGALVKVTLDGDRNLNGDYADDEVDEEKAPGLIAVQGDDASPSWSEKLVKIRLKGIPGGINAGQVIVEASTTAGGGQIKVWSTNTSPFVASLWIDTASGLTSKSWPLNPSSSMKDVPEWLYVQGTEANLNALKLQVRYETAGGALGAKDEVAITVVKMGLLPDFNHDKKIDTTDITLLATKAPYRFWINDDSDTGFEGNHIPGAPGFVDFQDWRNGHVDGVSDFVDFFSVALDIKDWLVVFPSTNWTYSLCQADGALNVLMATNLTPTTVGAFLIDKDWAEGHSADAVQQVTRVGCEIPTNILAHIIDGTGGVVLMEGRRASEKPLQLKITSRADSAIHCIVASMPLKLSGVEAFYRHLNLRAVACGSGGATNRLANPPNNPDALCLNKDVVVLHGVNVSGENARAWHAEMFKRLYWTGSLARFHGISYYSEEGWTGANYQHNVNHAFLTASNASDYVKSLTGDKIVIAHSMGNIVVSSAIHDYGMPVDNYIMLDAAVAAECLMPSAFNDATNNNPMLHAEWQQYQPRTWASEWSSLFSSSPSDSRSKLTWQDRFSAVRLMGPKISNVYSEEDECFEINPRCYGLLTGVDMDYGIWPSNPERHCWQKQEILKGRDGMAVTLGSTDWAGWGFRINWYRSRVYSPEEANVATDAQLRTNSVFRDNPASVFSATISQTMQNEILARGIPALSTSAGNKRLNLPGFANYNMSDYVNRPNGWPRHHPIYGTRWLHSDIKDMAYLYVCKAFEWMVSSGELNE